MTAGYLPPSITKPTASFGRILVALILVLFGPLLATSLRGGSFLKVRSWRLVKFNTL